MVYHLSMDGKKVIKALEKQGWKILRSQGSHYRLGKEQNERQSLSMETKF